MKSRQIHPRFGHQGRQPGDEVQWLEDNVCRAIAVRCFELVANLGRVVPRSREARLITRRAHSARGEAKRASERGVEPFAGVLRSQQRACDVVAKRHARRAAGALTGCRRSSAFWGLGCRSSRQGCESRRVRVPLPPIVRFRRLAYPLLREVTN